MMYFAVNNGSTSLLDGVNRGRYASLLTYIFVSSSFCEYYEDLMILYHHTRIFTFGYIKCQNTYFTTLFKTIKCCLLKFLE